MLYNHATFRMHTSYVTKETMTSNTEVSIREWLYEVLASVFDSNDDSNNFGHLDSESERKMK